MCMHHLQPHGEELQRAKPRPAQKGADLPIQASWSKPAHVDTSEARYASLSGLVVGATALQVLCGLPVEGADEVLHVSEAKSAQPQHVRLRMHTP